MELQLTGAEARLLRETLETALNELLLEIARADSRRAREDLRAREETMKGILDRLPNRGEVAA